MVFEFPARYKSLNDLSTDARLRKLESTDWTTLTSLKLVLNPTFYTIAPKVNKGSIMLNDISQSIRGVLANKEDIHENHNEYFKPYFIGGLYRYKYSNEFSGINYGEHLKEKPKDYSYFQGERILIRRLINRQFRLMAAFTSEEFVNKKDLYNLKLTDTKYQLKYILAIVNSTLISYLKTKGSASAAKDDFGQLTLSDIRNFPIKDIDLQKQKMFTGRVEIIENSSAKLEELIIKFTTYLQSQYAIIKLSKKLQSWDELSFGDFIKELNKAIKTAGGEPLTKLVEMEWMDVFEIKKAEAQALKAEIEKTDKAIDAMVYELYGLTEEEIGIVEGSL